jgi:hypothetical protein
LKPLVVVARACTALCVATVAFACNSPFSEEYTHERCLVGREDEPCTSGSELDMYDFSFGGDDGTLTHVSMPTRKVETIHACQYMVSARGRAGSISVGTGGSHAGTAVGMLPEDGGAMHPLGPIQASAMRLYVSEEQECPDAEAAADLLQAQRSDLAIESVDSEATRETTVNVQCCYQLTATRSRI